MRAEQWDVLQYFKAEEFDHPEELSYDLMVMVDAVRAISGVRLVPTSDYRPGDPLAHGRGVALDLSLPASKDRMRVVSAAIMVGFRRIGIYDKHIHLDIDRELPQDVMWWGTSD